MDADTKQVVFETTIGTANLALALGAGLAAAAAARRERADRHAAITGHNRAIVRRAVARAQHRHDIKVSALKAEIERLKGINKKGGL